ncbi:MAG: 5-bromo-4-chloroindolyl phosphate hydrolysis family protein [Lachnospiraceae bacterium]
MKKEKLTEAATSAAAGALAGIVFLILLFLLHWNFLIDALLSVGLFAAFYFLLKPQDNMVFVEKLPDAQELKKCLEEGRKNYQKIRECEEKIKDSEVKEEVKKLNQIAGNILHFLEEHPKKIRLARQFIDYYQNTASSLLEKYISLQDTSLKTEEVVRLKDDTARAMKTLQVVFENQFQKLLRNEMIDMDAELKLLEQTIKMENEHI